MLATLLTLAVTLPAAPQDPARDRLEASPRHHEWVELPPTHGMNQAEAS